jgi:HEPN domain-containing protein
MLEIKELLAPCAAIFALLFAAFAFLLPQALRLYNQTRAMLSKVEVPDSIQKNWRFTIGVYGHSMLLAFASIFSLFLGTMYFALLYRITQYYLGSQAYSANEILSDFSNLTLWVAVLAGIIVVSAFAMLANEIFISEKKYPTLLKTYIKEGLNIRPTDKEVSSLLPEARTLFDRGQYLESILYSTAALEYAIKSKLGVSPQYGWSNLIDIILQKMGASNAEKLRRIRQIRNSAAHPTPSTSITEKESKEVLEASSDLIRQLEQAG